MILIQIRYNNEIRNHSELNLPSSKSVSAKELQMAIALIKSMGRKFNPKEYKDTYFNELKRIIEQKAIGRKIRPKGKAPKTTAVKNLMTLLKKSIGNKAA